MFDIEAEDAGMARRRQQQRREDLDQGRLAGAVRTEQAEELAGFHPQVDTLEGDDGRGLGRVDTAHRVHLDRERRDRFDHGRGGRGKKPLVRRA